MIFKVRLGFILGLLSLSSACTNPAQDRFYRTEGAGLELYANDGLASDHFERENTLFNTLCQGVPLSSDSYVVGGEAKQCKLGDLNKTQWAGVVATGFNLIDSRCNQYLSWIGRKRDEKIFVNETATALTGLLSGVLAIASPESRALEYIGLALGFGSATYNTYNNLVMLSLDPTTIQILVRKRRLDYREKIQGKPITSKAQAVYSLSNYLDICTPEYIRLDVNSGARAAALGEIPFAEQQTTGQASVVQKISAPAPGEPFNGGSSVEGAGARRLENPDPTGSFGDFPNGSFGDQDMKNFQAATCIEADSKLGPDTLAALKVFEQAEYGALVDRPDLFNNRLDVTPELEELTSGPTASCDRTKYGNYYEAKHFGERDRNISVFLKLLNRAYPDNQIPVDATLNDPAVRAKIKAARAALGLLTGYPKLEDQVTFGLFVNIDAKARGETYDGPIRGIRAD